MKWKQGWIALMLTGCAAQQNAEPEILPTQNVAKYLVRVNFVMFSDEIAKHPAMAAAFQVALMEWRDALPIEAAIFVETQSSFPFSPFDVDMISTQPGIVRVHFQDIQATPYGLPDSFLGFWAFRENKLVLDADSLEIDPQLAHNVALHELGHVFGLPHFVNMGDNEAVTGSIVMPPDVKADTLVMYPIISDTNKSAKLSDLEVEIAMEKLLDLYQLPKNDCFHLTGN